MWGAILQDDRKASPDANLCVPDRFSLAARPAGYSLHYARSARFVPAQPVLRVSRIAVPGGLAVLACGNLSISHRRTPLRRATLLRMAEIYARDFADDDGRVRATFEIVWLSGWVPHSSQQQPLTPGTAKARLADALGTRELPAGEKVER